MTTVNLDSSARLIHEAIQQLGWSAEPTSLAERVKKLDLGLPAEDEFIFILSWLGKCSLVHKLDQGQFPPESKKELQVPDLLASFETKLGSKVVLIEVKVSNKKKLVWRPDYLKKLKNYASRLGLPLLVAWKFYGLWILVEVGSFLEKNKAFPYNSTVDIVYDAEQYKAYRDLGYTLGKEVCFIPATKTLNKC